MPQKAAARLLRRRVHVAELKSAPARHMVAAHGQLDHMPAPPDPAAPPPFSLSERGQLRVVRARTVEEPTVRGARTVYARRLRPTFVAEEPGLRVCSRPEEDRAGRNSIVYTAARLVFALLLQEERDELDTEVLADEGERNRPPAASRGEEGLILHRASSHRHGTSRVWPHGARMTSPAIFAMHTAQGTLAASIGEHIDVRVTT